MFLQSELSKSFGHDPACTLPNPTRTDLLSMLSGAGIALVNLSSYGFTYAGRVFNRVWLIWSNPACTLKRVGFMVLWPDLCVGLAILDACTPVEQVIQPRYRPCSKNKNIFWQVILLQVVVISLFWTHYMVKFLRSGLPRLFELYPSLGLAPGADRTCRSGAKLVGSSRIRTWHYLTC